jgi:hypothetical protein
MRVKTAKAIKIARQALSNIKTIITKLNGKDQAEACQI